VGPDSGDAIFLETILHQAACDRHLGAEWDLLGVPALASAFSVLIETPVAVVLCDTDLQCGSWQDMLEYFSRVRHPPLLIVTSRLADERLWAEALNLGAYDVLAKPFAPSEVIRSVTSAWRHWQEP
jgi:DNA-binding response OmpR family regulator